jgi:DNA-binding transcriptional MerR regulator
MLSIGSFASAARLSIKALRLYDQLGILKPCFVDPESGYRYYQADQLVAARLIRMLREMEMPLASIRQVLAAAPAQAEALVRGYWHERELRMEQARRVVQDTIMYLRKEIKAMPLEVSVKPVAPQPVISITQRIKVDRLSDHIKQSLQTLYALAEAQGLEPAGAPFGIYHGAINHEDDGPIEVCVPTQTLATPAGAIAARTLAGGQAAAVMLYDQYCEFPTILEGYDAVFDWVRQNGYEMAEAPREIWHGTCGDSEQMEVVLLFNEPSA